MIKKPLSLFFNNFNIIKYKKIDTGHINDSYMIEISIGNTTKYVFLQKLNTDIFKKPQKVMNNILKVSNHLSNKNYKYKILKPIPTHNKKYGDYIDDSYWRLFPYIKNSKSLDKVDSAQLAYKISKCFSNFIFNISDLDIKDIDETIESFHNIDKVWNNFINITLSNNTEKDKKVIDLVCKIKKKHYIVKNYNSLMVKKKIPIRVTHNDTKFNNVLVDNETLAPLAVIDLDTIMPSTILLDFGDMVRTFTNSRDEDCKEIDKVSFRIDIFEGMLKGFLEELKPIITIEEKNNLILGSKAIILEQVLRFINDYLQGNKYYKTKYKEHNLYRAQNQFKLLEDIEGNEKKINKLINKI